MNNNKNRPITLPNFNIYSAFSNSVLSVFIAIFTGIITEIIINNKWNCESIVFLSCCVIASVLLWIAIRINSKVNDLCQNIILNDDICEIRSSKIVYDKLWNEQAKGKYRYKHYREKFRWLLIISFVIVLIGAIFYVFKGQQQSVSITTPTTCYCENNGSDQNTEPDNILSDKIFGKKIYKREGRR